MVTRKDYKVLAHATALQLKAVWDEGKRYKFDIDTLQMDVLACMTAVLGCEYYGNFNEDKFREAVYKELAGIID